MEKTDISPEQAIREALVYEKRIRDMYKEAAAKTQDPTAIKLFGALAKDEQGHVDYLEHRLTQLETEGQVTVDTVPSVLSPKAFDRMVEKVEGRLDRDDRKDEKQMLSNALHAEVETSAFYRQMVERMTGPLQDMFSRFMEIEDGHVTMVQAELDYLSNTGFWFDFQEFDMEH
ncbi:MAG: ferritin family protein [Desulfobacterales bacterium]|jgi:bacterioferritin (cytochrome b1)